MRSRRNGYVYDCVLVDVNTQRDFFKPEAPRRVSNADTLVPALRRIIAWTLRNQVPMVSSLESHRREEAERYGVPPHCIDGTGGQQKLNFTLLPNRVAVEGDNTLAVPLDLFQQHQQVIFPKRTLDFLANPKADRFLTQLPAREYLICGLGLEYSVKALALGLIARNRSVTIIVDGCGYWSASAAEFALRQLVAKGANLVSVPELLLRKLPRLRRYSKLLLEISPELLRPRLAVYPALPPHGANGTNGGNGTRGTNGRAKTNGHGSTNGHGPSNGHGPTNGHTRPNGSAQPNGSTPAWPSA
jgi:nicotinamidase-related amidase